MFEDCCFRPERTGRPAVEKIAGIAVTLILHGILLYGIIHARFTVKLMPLDKDDVRSVMIVPPLAVSVPRIVGGSLPAGLPEGLTEEVLPGLPGDTGEAGKAGLPGSQAAVQGGPLPPAAPGAGPPDTPGRAIIASLSSRFRESLVSHPGAGGDPRLRITLAPPGTPAGSPGGAVGSGTGPYPDFSTYISGPWEGGRGGTGAAGGRGGRGRGGTARQMVGISIPLKGYDLAPWAGQVVDRIQRFWALPTVSALPGRASIRFIVIINKGGELDSIEIIDGTTVESLDRAALEALRASLPFPALPEDFPGDLLEIHFDFTYDLQ
jgi:TonB family protein